ncbi:uncharacterized protein Fot_29602 [Forsythia ovata]|uniref:PB1 domain-containing protein n=1 Tax=Forsythia ovata TaxID=205694 RepID=A0ABD1TRC0_9LAMI
MSQVSTSDTNSTNRTETIKFLYSYGGRIVPRSTEGRDGMLRYEGGHTRVLSVDRSISFAELMVKFGDLCSSSVYLKCKLPNHDLDQLVSIKSDEELKTVIEEYLTILPEEKIRVVLFPVSVKKISPPSSPLSCFEFPSRANLRRKSVAATAACRYATSGSPVARYSVATGKSKYQRYEGRSPRHLYFVPQWSYSHSY